MQSSDPRFTNKHLFWNPSTSLLYGGILKNSFAPKWGYPILPKRSFAIARKHERFN
jgi:hypothetical protein